MFDAPKVNDALLFMTILSTDLRALRRRGYNVDRILRQQQAEREAAEKLAREKAEKTSPRPAPEPTPLISPSTQTTAAFSEERKTSMEDEIGSLPGALPTPLESQSRPSSVMSSLQNFKRKFANKNESHSGPSHPSGTAPEPSSHVTPLSNISSNIDRAIRACREETGNVLENRSQMQMVTESEGYCDVSGRVGNLSLLGEMGNIKVFVTGDVPEAASLMNSKRDSIARFIHVILPIRNLYQLSPTSVHIFYDNSGGTIAFNRNASIFLNLRYYEAWHDEDVRKSNLSPAYISWYFSLAHEIAHNLVQPHNSEHEFYFSSICEKYLPSLSKLISG